MPDSRFEELARGALLEITGASTIGPCLGEVDEGDGVVSVLFESAMAGYPGWKWTVSVAQVEGEAPTVLETELMPADGALLAPDWLPWSDRLAEYKAAQAALEGTDAAGDDLDDPDEDDDPDGDDSDDEDDDLDDELDDLDDELELQGDDELDADLEADPDDEAERTP